MTPALLKNVTLVAAKLNFPVGAEEGEEIKIIKFQQQMAKEQQTVDR